MPPKPTLGAEPDLALGETHHGASEPYLPVPGGLYPLFPEEVEKVVGIFYWYKYHGRPLIRAEIQDMISFRYQKKTHGKFMNHHFRILEKQVATKGKTEYEYEINKRNPNGIWAEVDAIYNSYCDADEDAKDRRDVLMGVKVRVPHLEMPHLPLWEGKSIRADQLYCLFGLANWCETDNGDLLPEDLVVQIFATKMKFQSKARKHTALVKRLRKAEDELTHEVHKILKSHEDIESHFRNLALRFYSEHTVRKISGSAEDPLAATTSAFSALTIPAIAGPSWQSGGTPGKETLEEEEDEWSSLHDFDTESGSAGPSRARTSPPQQGTTGVSHRTARRRERESTESSSPASGAGPSEETIGSKDKGKKPERKRQRP